MPPAARTAVSAIRAIELVCGPATRAAHDKTHRLNRGFVAASNQDVRDERKAGVRATEHEGASFGICGCHQATTKPVSAVVFLNRKTPGRPNVPRDRPTVADGNLWDGDRNLWDGTMVEEKAFARCGGRSLWCCPAPWLRISAFAAALFCRPPCPARPSSGQRMAADNEAACWRSLVQRTRFRRGPGSLSERNDRRTPHAASENRFARNVLSAALPSRVASDMVANGCSERSICRDLPATQISHRQGFSPGSRRLTTTE